MKIISKAKEKEMFSFGQSKKLALVVTLVLLASLILGCGGPQETLVAPTKVPATEVPATDEPAPGKAQGY